MNYILNFFAPPAAIEPIRDQNKIKEEYRYWRWRIFYSMFIGYALYYFTRKSFTFAMTNMVIDLGFDTGQVGFLASVLSITYALSKFISGVFGDQANARYLMPCGLILTGICNILFGLSSTLPFFALFWGLNGWFQGFGWPPCARLLTHWYSQNERGRWWSSWNVSHNVGGFLIPLIAAFAAQHFGWRYALHLPGAICIVMGFYLMNRLRDTPQSLGLPSIEQFRQDYGSYGKKADAEKQLSTKEILFKFVIKNKFIWLLAIASFFVHIIRIGVNDWTAIYLRQVKGYSQLSANWCVSLFEAGGFIGSLVAGWSSDRIFNGRRGPVNVLFSAALIFVVSSFWLFSGSHPWIDSFLTFWIGFLIFGPQVLIGMAAAELSHKNAAATSSGFVGCFAYMGAAFAGWPLGQIIKVWGWEGFFVATAISSVISTLFFLPLWKARQGIVPVPTTSASVELKTLVQSEQGS